MKFRHKGVPRVGSDMSNVIRRHLTILSEMSNLKKVREFISQAVSDSALPSQERNKVMLATDEAIANLVKHGYKGREDGIIEVEVSADKEKFQIVISDMTDGFDFDAIKEPNLEEHYRLGRNSGLGIYLIRKIMDEVTYQRGEKNSLTLVKYISPKVQK